MVGLTNTNDEKSIKMLKKTDSSRFGVRFCVLVFMFFIPPIR